MYIQCSKVSVDSRLRGNDNVSNNSNKIEINMKQYFVYILASGKNGTLYIGVTGNLERRIYEHKHKLIDGFTKKYNIDKLVYYE